MTEDEMIGWDHQLNGHEFEQTLGDRGQRSLACCSPWGHKEPDTTATEQQQRSSEEDKPRVHSFPSMVYGRVGVNKNEIWRLLHLRSNCLLINPRGGCLQLCPRLLPHHRLWLGGVLEDSVQV